MSLRVRAWAFALIALITVVLAGCGSGSNTSGTSDTVVAAGGSSQNTALSVRVVDSPNRAVGRFDSSVTSFVLNVFNGQGNVVGSTSAPRSNDTVLILYNLPAGASVLQLLAVDQNNQTVGFYQSPLTVPNPGQIVVNSGQFTAGSTPPPPSISPMPVPTPTPVPPASPTPRPSATPQASPGASPAASPSSSPAASPAASPSPGSSPAASPTPAASPSPAGTPTPLPSPSPFPSLLPSPSPGASPVATGSLTMQGSGDPNGARDFICQGLNWSYTNSNAQFSSQGNNTNFVTIFVNGTNGAIGTQPNGANNTQFWTCSFRALGNQTLVPGTYTNCARAAFAPPTQPGLDISGDGRGSNQVASNSFFVVNECVFDSSGFLKRFSADFKEFSETNTAMPFTGQIRYSIP